MAGAEDLGGFLRRRRARVSPRSLGLPVGTRRRVPGLRREELAQLAGISVEYYQRLEQGRATHPSQEVLDALARTLGLTALERTHLGTLAARRRPAAVSWRAAVEEEGGPTTARAAAAERAGPAEPGPAVAEGVGVGGMRPQLGRMLESLEGVPAMIINDRFDVLGANPLAARLVIDVAARAVRFNLARYLFLMPRAREFYVEWDAVAADTAGQLRLTAGRYPDDGELAALIDELMTAGEDFRTLWAAGGVEQRSSGAKSFRHPALGVLRLHYENFALLDDPRQRLVMFLPEEDGATEAAVRLAAGWADPAPRAEVGPEPAWGGPA